jgi:hypothetical protein
MIVPVAGVGSGGSQNSTSTLKSLPMARAQKVPCRSVWLPRLSLPPGV